MTINQDRLAHSFLNTLATRYRIEEVSFTLASTSVTQQFLAYNPRRVYVFLHCVSTATERFNTILPSGLMVPLTPLALEFTYEKTINLDFQAPTLALVMKDVGNGLVSGYGLIRE